MELINDYVEYMLDRQGLEFAQKQPGVTIFLLVIVALYFAWKAWAAKSTAARVFEGSVVALLAAKAILVAGGAFGAIRTILLVEFAMVVLVLIASLVLLAGLCIKDVFAS